MALVEVYTPAGHVRHAARTGEGNPRLQPLCGRPTRTGTWALTADAAVPDQVEQIFPNRCQGCQQVLAETGQPWPARGRPT